MKDLFAGLKAQKRQQQRLEIDRALLHYEARIGGKLFGPVPNNYRREFFCLDERTWVWHEEWRDETGKQHSMTTRYDVRPHGILKSQGGASYQKVRGAEAKHFLQAVKLYMAQVGSEYNRLLQSY